MVLEGFGDCAQLEFLDFARGGFGEVLGISMDDLGSIFEVLLCILSNL